MKGLHNSAHLDGQSRRFKRRRIPRENSNDFAPMWVENRIYSLADQKSRPAATRCPWYFRRAQIGKLVGTTTWGGLVGIGGYPPLIDGGTVTGPRFGI